MNISDIITANSKRIAAWPAVISEEQEISWGEFDSKINKMGNALLRCGISKGDRVAMYLPNSPEYLITYFAIAKIGAIAVPFNIMYKSSEINYIMNNSQASILVGASKEVAENVVGIREELPSLNHIISVGDNEHINNSTSFSSIMENENDVLETVDCSPEDVATILYTSGTTGNPKGAMLTHKNFWDQSDLNGCYILHINDQDRLLTAAPFCHIFFVTTVLGPMYKGAAVVTMERFAPDKALEMIDKFQVTHFAGVPTMYIYMLQHYRENKSKYNLNTLRIAQSAGSAMPGDFIPQIEENFNVHYCECYGATETAAACSYERVGHAKPGSIGLTAHTWQVKIVNSENQEAPTGEVGEIIVKGPGVFKGYWNMPEATDAAFSSGWFHTGDLAYKDEDGYLFIVDRKKDMIICGGYNVYPREIEELILSHPEVLETAVIGVEDTEKGEIPKAFVVPKEAGNISESDIIDYCKKHLAAYKAPRIVNILEELPKTSTGKILKRELSK